MKIPVYAASLKKSTLWSPCPSPKPVDASEDDGAPERNEGLKYHFYVSKQKNMHGISELVDMVIMVFLITIWNEKHVCRLESTSAVINPVITISKIPCGSGKAL